MQGSINFDGTLSGSIAGGGGGGSEVTITPVLTSGTKIADYTIDETTGSLYAPTPEALPGTIVTKALRKYNDTSQTKIMTVTTLDTSNNQEVSQDIYAPSPVQCWYTPGLEQDYVIGQFTYAGVTTNVYIPDFQRPLTAGANITIDQDNVISATGGGAIEIYTDSVTTSQYGWVTPVNDKNGNPLNSNNNTLLSIEVINGSSGNYYGFLISNANDVYYAKLINVNNGQVLNSAVNVDIKVTYI